MQPSAVVFDVDGTLIDTYRLYLEAYSRALEPMLGYAPSHEEIVAHRPSSERAFLEQLVGGERVDECHGAMCRHYEALHTALCEGPYDGVREMLAHLRSAGIPLGIVTGKGRRAWETTARELDLGDFPVVVTEDDVDHPKPDPGGVRRAAAELGLDPRELVYIGDSISDLRAGRAAGARTAAALWPKTGPGEREDFLARIEAERPDWVFERPADISRTFAPWC